MTPATLDVLEALLGPDEELYGPWQHPAAHRQGHAEGQATSGD